MAIISGIATSSQAMTDEMATQQILANNLANQTTVGFKQDSPVIKDFSKHLLAALPWSVDAAGLDGTSPQIGTMQADQGMANSGLDLAQGSLRTTKQPLDLALVGDGFFAVRTAQGDMYTRNGSFHLDATGNLLTTTGAAVLNSTGTPFRFPKGTVTPAMMGAMTIRHNGDVLLQGKLMGTLRLASLSKQGLQEMGGGLYTAAQGAGQPPQATTVAVVQGALENSNVNLSQTMTRVMSVARTYELNQKMAQLQDDTVSLAADQVGRVG